MGFKFFKESICTAFLMNGDYVHFLWLLKQMTTNWVVYNSIYLFSYSSGRLKFNMGFSGLKSRCQQGHTTSGGSKGKSFPWLFQLLCAVFMA